jgi:hypothetical protein
VKQIEECNRMERRAEAGESEKKKKKLKKI